MQEAVKNKVSIKHEWLNRLFGQLYDYNGYMQKL